MSERCHKKKKGMSRFGFQIGFVGVHPFRQGTPSLPDSPPLTSADNNLRQFARILVAIAIREQRKAVTRKCTTPSVGQRKQGSVK